MGRRDNTNTDRDDRRESRGRRGPGRGHGPRGKRGGPHRARRGAVAQSTLLVLESGPKHGYDIIAQLEELSGGTWKPSPGAMYPALGKLEERGLIEGVGDDDTKREYQLTDMGRERVEEMRATGDTTPWERAEEHGGGLKRQMAELAGPVRQVGRFGSAEQVAAAAEVLQNTVGELYRILAERPDAPAEDDAS